MAIVVGTTTVCSFPLERSSEVDASVDDPGERSRVVAVSPEIFVVEGADGVHQHVDRLARGVADGELDRCAARRGRGAGRVCRGWS